MGEQIINTVVDAMTGYATGTAGIIVDVFDKIFITGSGDAAALTNFGTYSLVFLGIGVVTSVIGAIVYKVG